MKHLIARHNSSFVVGLKDRAYLVFDAKAGNDSPAGSVLELLPLSGQKAERQKESTLTSEKNQEKPSESTSDKKDNTKNEQKFLRNKVHDRRKSADEQLNEICAVAIIGGAAQSFHCAVARNNKTLDVYTVKLENLAQKTCQPSLQYRTPKRVSSFTFANIPASSESFATNVTVPLLISVDLAGDSYAYNLIEKGQRLLLGHTASMLTHVAIAENGSDSSLLLTSDRDEKIRISRFPESYIIEGFLLGHTAFVTGFALIPSSSPSLVVSCAGDMTLRLWDLSAQVELSSTPTGNDDNNSASEIPTAIATSCCGRIAAVIFDGSRRLSIYKVNSKNSEGNQIGTPSLELLDNVECPSQPLSIVFNDSSGASSELTVLMKDPNYVAVYDIQHMKEDVSKPIAVPKNEMGVIQALKDAASNEKLSMPNTILEKDDFGNPVLRKENETRGPAAEEAPWNRVERVEIAKEREKRRKKRPKLANDN